MSISNEFHVISLGMGTQSSAMLIDALKGKFNFYPDLAVFSDLGTEPQKVYSFATELSRFVKREFNFEISIINPGNYKEDIAMYLSGESKRVSTPPLFVDPGNGKPGKLMRQCTADYKIFKIRSFAKSEMKKAGKKKMVMHIGITMEEFDRAGDIMYDKSGKKKSPKYITDSFPYIQQIQKHKHYCIDLLKGYGLNPFKSSCKFCPFHSNSFWYEMKTNAPEEFKECVEIDYMIRNWPKINGLCYLHKSLRPLDKIEFEKLSPSMFNVPAGNCHSGFCGV